MDADRTTPATENRRLRGRVRLRGAACSLGRILDVSATGLRIRLGSGVDLRVGDQVQTTLSTPFLCAKVVVRVVWLRRVGLFGCDMGVSLVRPTDETARVMADLARSGLDRYGGDAD
ncbi:MAG: PilZ domain-containing protein [Phycisphaerales bacterium]|nr:PilZ domain-containing protein [Phycisphaerales bacterium]